MVWHFKALAYDEKRKSKILQGVQRLQGELKFLLQQFDVPAQLGHSDWMHPFLLNVP